MTNPEDFDADLAGRPDAEVHLAADDKQLQRDHPELTGDQLAQLTVLDPGSPFDQGSTYVDLDDPERQPFTALGGQSAGSGQRIVAKRGLDFELWNALVGQGRQPEAITPDTQT